MSSGIQVAGLVNKAQVESNRCERSWDLLLNPNTVPDGEAQLVKELPNWLVQRRRCLTLPTSGIAADLGFL